MSSEKERAARQDRRENADYQRAVGEFVHREVIYCVSGIVSETTRQKSDEWFHLFVQDDWRTPAREAIPDMPREKLLEFLGENDCDVNADSSAAALSSNPTCSGSASDCAAPISLFQLSSTAPGVSLARASLSRCC